MYVYIYYVCIYYVFIYKYVCMYVRMYSSGLLTVDISPHVSFSK